MRRIRQERRLGPDSDELGAEDGLMAVSLEPDDFEVGNPGPAQARTQPIASLALAIGVVTGILVALELFRPVHGIDAGARAAVETTIALAAVLSCSLLIAIFDRTRQLRELLLVLGILALELADFTYWAGAMVAGVRGRASGGVIWLVWELVGALALAAAALVPPTSIVEPLRALAKGAAVLGLTVIAVGIFLVQIFAVHPATAGTARPGSHFLTVGVEVASGVILAVAGFAFVARSWRAERGTGLLAGVSLVLAVAGVQFVTVPTVAADWVTPRDGARLVAFGLLLGGVCLRYAKSQRRYAYTAICSDRERIARDLHDGLAQDLACITTQAQRFDCRLGPDDPVMLATRDALAELRGMIADLTASTAPSSEAAVRLIAHELANRLDVQVDVRSDAGSAHAVDNGLDLTPRDDLIRAARHAILEAALPGDARHVDVALLRRAGTLVVRVSHGGNAASHEWPGGVAQPDPRLRRASRFSRDRPPRAKLWRPA